MAKRQKQITTEPKVQAAPDTDGLEGSAMAHTQEAPVPAQHHPRRPPHVEVDEDEEDLDEEEEEEHFAGAQEDDEEEEDLDEDEEEEDDEEDEDKEPPPVPSFPVANTDATLLSFLAAITTDDRAAAHGLADWLVDQGDPRAAHVRELAEARCVLPEGSCPLLRAAPMACGASWTIVRRTWCVSALTYWDTPLYNLVRASRPSGDVTVRIARDRETPELLGAAFERCRVGLLLALFGTSPEHLRARQVILAENNLRRVDKVLARHEEAAVPWLLELREANRARFDEIFARITETSDLHELGYTLLDTLEPGWRQRLPAMMAGGAGSSTQ
jgi:hypothetical protein